MTWMNPVPYTLVPTDDTESYRNMPDGHTGLPLAPHPGAFGVRRQCHVHEGIDLYVPVGTEVRAVEAGVVVARITFTGPNAEPPSGWWHDTDALLVEGETGTVVYGEIRIDPGLEVGDRVDGGRLLGTVLEVLTKQTDRPKAMLHLELHEHGARDAYEWPVDGRRPPSLKDPTALLLACAIHDGDHHDGSITQ